MNPNDPQRYLDPLVLAKVRSLELQARMIVEGYLSGMHKSPYHGFSVEFAQHREYVPGDDIRHVDWKVYGRTERYFLKQYEEETNLICWLLLDISESMRYGSTEVSKYDYACMASAALAHLVLQQQDSVGLVTFDDQVRRLIKPSSQPSHLKEIVQVMNQGAERQKTKLAGILHELAERFNRRGLVMVFSDLFDDSENAPGDFVAALKHLRHRRHDVVVFHVLDRAELEFPFQEATLFKGMEHHPDLLTDPRSLRQSYLDEIQSFIRQVKRGCLQHNIDYVQLSTDKNLGIVLSSYLSRRLSRRAR